MTERKISGYETEFLYLVQLKDTFSLIRTKLIQSIIPETIIYLWIVTWFLFCQSPCLGWSLWSKDFLKKEEHFTHNIKAIRKDSLPQKKSTRFSIYEIESVGTFTSVQFVSKKLLGYTKEILVQVFSCEFYEISKNTFFTEHLWASASIRRPSFE